MGLGGLGQWNGCCAQGNVERVDRSLGNGGCCWRLLLGGAELLHQMVLDETDISQGSLNIRQV